jgi:hypothetical protein
MDRPGGLKVVDAHGQSLAYVYSREKPDDAKGLHHLPLLSHSESCSHEAHQRFDTPQPYYAAR